MFTPQLLRQHSRRSIWRPAFSNSPPSVGQRMRAFHASAPRKDWQTAVLYLPHEMLQLLHTGLPWYAALPAAAFIVRSVLVIGIGSRVRDNISRYVALHPLRNAIAIGIRDRLPREQRFRSPNEARQAIQAHVRSATGQLDKRWRCSLWGQAGWTFAQLPIFVTFQEVVRRITGTSQGLWGLVVGSATGVKAEDGGRRVYSTDIDSNPWFEASLANEGMLWFPDLLVPDPTGILPYVVSAVMMTNIALTNNTPHVHESQSKLQGRLKICMMVFAGMMGPLLQGMPASMLLYFVSSTGSALLWNVLYMDRKYPLVKGLKPCKRPLVDVPAPSELVKR